MRTEIFHSPGRGIRPLPCLRLHNPKLSEPITACLNPQSSANEHSGKHSAAVSAGDSSSCIFYREPFNCVLLSQGGQPAKQNRRGEERRTGAAGDKRAEAGRRLKDAIAGREPGLAVPDGPTAVCRLSITPSSMSKLLILKLSPPPAPCIQSGLMKQSSPAFQTTAQIYKQWPKRA